MINPDYSLSQVTISITMTNFNKPRYIYKGSASEIDADNFFLMAYYIFLPRLVNKNRRLRRVIQYSHNSIYGVLYACSCPLGIAMHCLAV